MEKIGKKQPSRPDRALTRFWLYLIRLDKLTHLDLDTFSICLSQLDILTRLNLKQALSDVHYFANSVNLNQTVI